ncbi:MAG: protein kinase [Deltaproteobacteria bacterium]|nr:protein kinase [Deltaproteobacteria bacterium]
MGNRIVGGKYELLRRLGRGGMAEVYLGRMAGAARFQKTFAVKLVLPHLIESPNDVALFVDEAKLVAQLTHSNIVQVFDFGVDGEDIFLVMEYVEGCTLRALLTACANRGRTAPLDIALFVMSQVCRGLDYAHRKRDDEGRPLALIHRDLDPNNVLISDEGEVKISDFGIARSATQAHHSDSGALRGKVFYMPPEAIAARPVDQRADQFILGAVFYEVLTGKKAFATEPVPWGVFEKIRKGEYEPVRTANPSVPAEVETVVDRLLAVQPERRFANSGDMLAQIEMLRRIHGGGADATVLGDFLRRVVREGGTWMGTPAPGLAPPAGAGRSTTWSTDFDTSPGIASRESMPAAGIPVPDFAGLETAPPGISTQPFGNSSRPSGLSTHSRAPIVAPGAAGPDDAVRLDPMDLARLSDLLVESPIEETGTADGEVRDGVIAAICYRIAESGAASEARSDDLHAHMRRVIERVLHGRGAATTPWSESRLIAVWGLASNIEDAAARAVACSLELVEVARHLSGISHSPGALELRVGIGAGQAVCEWRSDRHVVVEGEPIEATRAMCALADANEIVVSARVHEACRDRFRWATPAQDRAGDLFVPAGHAPWALASVAGAKGAAAPPLVGRDDELALLRAAWDLIRARTDRNRRGGAVHHILEVGGEAGSGKTRLVEEFIAAIAEDPPLVLRAFAHAHDPRPFAAWTTLLAGFLGVPEDDDDGWKVALLAVANDVADTRSRTAFEESVPILASLAAATRLYTTLTWPAEEADETEWFIALRNFVRALAWSHRPLLLVFEDMQWLDAASRRALEFVLQNCDVRQGIFVVGLERGGDDAPGHGPNPHAHYATRERIRLTPLGEESARDLLRALLPGLEDRTESPVDARRGDPGTVREETRGFLSRYDLTWRRVRAGILERSGGNPYLLLELIRAIRENGDLVCENGRWRFTSPQVGLALPATAIDLALARVDRLGPEPKRALHIAAVLGASFVADAFAHVATKIGHVGDPRAILGDLEARGLLVREDPGRYDRYRFREIIVRETVYQAVLAPVRARVHRIAAEYLETRPERRDIFVESVVASHWAACGRLERAITWGCEALRTLRRHGQHEECVEWTDRVLAWIGECPPSGGIEARQLEMLEAREASLGLLGRTAQREQTLEQILALLGDRPAHRVKRGIAFERLAVVRRIQGRIPEAIAYLHDALEILRECGQRRYEGKAENGLAVVYGELGRPAEEMEHYRAAQALFEEIDEKRELGRVHNNIGMHHLDSGRVPEAIASIETAIRLFRQIHYRREEAYAVKNLGLAHRQFGDIDRAEGYFRRALALAREVGDLHGEGRAHNNIGMVEYDRGRLDEARDAFLPAMEIHDEVEDAVGGAIVQLNLGLCDQYANRLESALAHIDAAVARFGGADAKRYSAVAQSYRGQQLFELGRIDEARSELLAAADILAEAGEREHLAFTHCRLAAMRIAAEELDRAGESLAQVEHLLASGDLPLVRLVYHAVIGRAALAAGGPDDPETVAAAVREYRRVLDLLEKQRIGPRNEYSAEFTRLRIDLASRGVGESRLPLPAHWDTAPRMSAPTMLETWN